MNVTIRIEPHYISFKDKDGDIIYDIRKADLKDTLKLEEGIISFWVSELVKRRWVPREMLSKLCEAIKREVPDNEIDWKLNQAYINFYM